MIAQAAVYLALAPKSCAVYRAFNAAMKACQDEAHASVPLHIRNAPTALMRGLGYGKDYSYAPDNGYVRGHGDLGFLPSQLGAGRTFFDPNDCEAGHQLHLGGGAPACQR